MCKRYEVHLKDDVMFVGDHISPVIPKEFDWLHLWDGPTEAARGRPVTSIRASLIAYIVDNGAPDAEPEP